MKLGSHVAYVILKMDIIREFLIVENIHLVCLLDITADFGVKTNAKLTPNCQLHNQSKTGIQSCLYKVTLTLIFLKFPDFYSLIYNFSDYYEMNAMK